MWHPLYVAIYSRRPILGLLHDAVEDGYLPKFVLRFWPALDAITRRDTETYAEYIERVAANADARQVKLADLKHNMTRNGGATPSLTRRYIRAQKRLTQNPEK